MSTTIYRYSFPRMIAAAIIEANLVLALWGVQALHGEAQVRLDTAHYWDRRRRVCIINAETRIGRDLNRLFVGFLRHELGDRHFQVAHVPRQLLPKKPQRRKKPQRQRGASKR